MPRAFVEDMVTLPSNYKYSYTLEPMLDPNCVLA